MSPLNNNFQLNKIYPLRELLMGFRKITKSMKLYHNGRGRRVMHLLAISFFKSMHSVTRKIRKEAIQTLQQLEETCRVRIQGV